MHKFLISFIIACSLLSAAKATAQSTGRPVDALYFHSDFEKKQFTGFAESRKMDRIAMLLAVDSLSSDPSYTDLSASVNDLIQNLEKKLGNERSMAKKVKHIFRQVHENYFSRYELGAPFHRIFRGSVFNCVSGSALYALVFEHFKIPYVIKETPTHVYIVVDPDKENILVESTDPAAGYMNPDEKFKRNYIDHLIKMKLITAQDLEIEGLSSLFNRTFFDKDNITIDQLIGLQYYNFGVEQLNRKNYLSAHRFFEKANFIYPSVRIAYFSTISLAATLDNADYSKLSQVDAYVKLYNISNDYKEEGFLNDFERMTQMYLIEKNNASYYEEIYQKIKTGISDTSFVRSIDLVYHTEKGRAAYLAGNYKKAMEYLEKALIQNPQHLEVRMRYLHCVTESARNSDLNKSLKIVEEQCAKFPFLLEYQEIMKIYSLCYLVLSASEFEIDNRQKGMDLLKKFETFKADREFQPVEEAIAAAYGSAWASYARIGKRDQARAFLLKGLEYAPGNKELSRQLRIANEAR